MVRTESLNEMSLRKNGEVKLKWKIQAIIWRSNMKQRITEKAGEKQGRPSERSAEAETVRQILRHSEAAGT